MSALARTGHGRLEHSTSRMVISCCAAIDTASLTDVCIAAATAVAAAAAASAVEVQNAAYSADMTDHIAPQADSMASNEADTTASHQETALQRSLSEAHATSTYRTIARSSEKNARLAHSEHALKNTLNHIEMALHVKSAHTELASMAQPARPRAAALKPSCPASGGSARRRLHAGHARTAPVERTSMATVPVALTRMTWAEIVSRGKIQGHNSRRAEKPLMLRGLVHACKAMRGGAAVKGGACKGATTEQPFAFSSHRRLFLHRVGEACAQHAVARHKPQRQRR